MPPPTLAVPMNQKKKAKEKPKAKVPIPGTSWTRVTTNEGNVFYFEKESKKSEWSVPDEIKSEVEQLEAEEKARREEEEKEDRLEKLKEAERVRLEIEEERKAMLEARVKAAEGKRKEREENGEPERETKVAKTEGETEDGLAGPVNDEDEAAWMRAVAAEFSAADSELKDEQERSEEVKRAEEVEAAKKVFSVPTQVNVTIEEQRALFKVGPGNVMRSLL